MPEKWLRCTQFNVFHPNCLGLEMATSKILLLRRAGAIMLLGVGQFTLMVILAEALYPGYSVANNWISDLGVGPSAWIFNPSVVFLGLMFIAAAYFLNRAGWRIYPILQTIAGIGAMGVGLFPETTGTPHIVAAFLAFGIGGLAAVYSYRLQSSPLRYYSLVLGAIPIIALILTALGITFGIGKGGVERMVMYPIIIWSLAFAGYLLNAKR